METRVIRLVSVSLASLVITTLLCAFGAEGDGRGTAFCNKHHTKLKGPLHRTFKQVVQHLIKNTKPNNIRNRYKLTTPSKAPGRVRVVYGEAKCQHTGECHFCLTSIWSIVSAKCGSTTGAQGTVPGVCSLRIELHPFF
ncbi:hypothetical protein O6H91_Y311500 [Diphasiastrum complanatum]|nr:hypothetical protein O6H91_Y311500 [Diphasiastrum complanatum]